MKEDQSLKQEQFAFSVVDFSDYQNKKRAKVS